MRFPAWLLILLLIATTTFSQTRFKFAWLSDTHVGSTTGEEDLRRSIADINSMNDIAFVIHSGDVTEMGSNKELNTAKQLLDSLKMPHYICPGNHDTRWSESGCTAFPKLFGNDKFVFDHSGFRFIGLHQGPRMRMGDGHWAPEDMRWLDSVLANTNKQQALFFVTHYPVDTSIANWYVMLDKVKRFNTQGILHGHGHRNGIYNFEGVAGIMSRSNLRARDSLGGYTIGEIRNDTLFVSERTPGIRTGKPWHYVPLSNKNYLTDTAKYFRPDYSINERYPEVRVKWKFKSGSTITSKPAVTGNSIFVGDGSGILHALELQNGTPLWRFATHGAIHSSPTQCYNVVLFGSTDSNFYSLDIKTGAEVWRLKTNAPIVSSPSTPSFPCWQVKSHNFQRGRQSPHVYFGGGDHTFRAVNSTTGKVVWRFENIGGFVETTPLRYDGKVIFGAWDGYLYALNEMDGTLAWKWKGEQEGSLLSPAACTPVGAKGKVFIAAPDRKLTALDAKTGEIVWRTSMFQVRESLGKSESTQEYKFYIRTLRDSILALSSYTNEPDIRWVTNAGFGYDHNSAQLMERDGTLFYGTRNGLLIALNARNGAIKWQHKTGVALLNTVAPVDGRRVVASNADGEVMLVEGEN